MPAIKPPYAMEAVKAARLLGFTIAMKNRLPNRKSQRPISVKDLTQMRTLLEGQSRNIEGTIEFDAEFLSNPTIALNVATELAPEEGRDLRTAYLTFNVYADFKSGDETLYHIVSATYDFILRTVPGARNKGVSISAAYSGSFAMVGVMIEGVEP
jgi:hypothetical protein